VHPWLKEPNSDDDDDEDDEKDDEEDDVDFDSISGNINYVNVDNLFYKDNYKVKLSYANYCCITEDFTTKQLD